MLCKACQRLANEWVRGQLSVHSFIYPPHSFVRCCFHERVAALDRLSLFSSGDRSFWAVWGGGGYYITLIIKSGWTGTQISISEEILSTCIDWSIQTLSTIMCIWSRIRGETNGMIQGLLYADDWGGLMASTSRLITYLQCDITELALPSYPLHQSKSWCRQLLIDIDTNFVISHESSAERKQ